MTLVIGRIPAEYAWQFASISEYPSPALRDQIYNAVGTCLLREVAEQGFGSENDQALLVQLDEVAKRIVAFPYKIMRGEDVRVAEVD